MMTWCVCGRVVSLTSGNLSTNYTWHCALLAKALRLCPSDRQTGIHILRGSISVPLWHAFLTSTALDQRVRLCACARESVWIHTSDHLSFHPSSPHLEDFRASRVVFKGPVYFKLVETPPRSPYAH